MALAVTHPFVSLIADDPTAVALGEVAPSNWNAAHTITGTIDASQLGLGATLAFVGGLLTTVAMTGDVTAAANSFVTTVAKIQGTVVSGTTGTTNVVFSASPTLTGAVTINNLTAGALSALGVLDIVGTDTVATRIGIDTFAAAGGLDFRRADGTNVVKTALATDDNIGSINWRGYDGTTYKNPRAIIGGFAANTWGAGDNSTYLKFSTTPIGSTSAPLDRIIIENNGNVSVGTRFFAAQPAHFNVYDNQAPLDNTRWMYYGIGNLSASAGNGVFQTGYLGSTTVPYHNSSGGAASFFQGIFDAGTNVSYFNMLYDAEVRAGTGGVLQGLLVQTTSTGTWAPGTGLAGNSAINSYANTLNGGYTWGGVVTAAASGSADANITGLEIDVQYSAGAGGAKTGLSIVDQLNNATGTSTAPSEADALEFHRVTGASGFKRGIVFYAAGTGTDFPIITAGSLFVCEAGTIANGIDISAATISGSAFKSPGFSVDGTGSAFTGVATFMSRTTVAWNNGAGAQAATLLNGPSAGNPTKWIPVDDNTVTRYIPAW